MEVAVQTLAARYEVSRRTIFRWKFKGVDVFDALAVAAHVGSNPRARLPVLKAVALAAILTPDKP